MDGWQLVGVTVLCLLAALFLGMVFLLTQSRGGYIGLALTLLALLLIAVPARWRWYGLVLMVVLVLVLGFVVSSHWEAVRTWATNPETNSAFSLNSLQARLEIWPRAVYGIQDFPFTGMGMGTFRKVVPVLYPLFGASPDIDIGHAHNEFLQAALDLGIPGLIAFIALYLGAFRMLVDVWVISRPSSAAVHLSTVLGLPSSSYLCAIVLGLGGGLIAHMLFGLTDAVALGAKPGLLFWMLLALICGLHAQVYASTKLPVNTAQP
jgi:putative inorganic carbon (HCO3(-)) transporter